MFFCIHTVREPLSFPDVFEVTLTTESRVWVILGYVARDGPQDISQLDAGKKGASGNMPDAMSKMVRCVGYPLVLLMRHTTVAIYSMAVVAWTILVYNVSPPRTPSTYSRVFSHISCIDLDVFFMLG